ncbi:MAG: helix-turn-helix transcriptional regulator [Clostridia bacterium]|nr:helix-turn-helix transcriptional regulator [Clostridia bacterium]
MINYSPFWETLHKSNETTYTLINKHHISSATIDKLRKNKPLNTTTINDLCRILYCEVENIMKYIPSEEDQKL